MDKIQSSVAVGAIIIGSLCFVLYAIDVAIGLLKKPATITAASDVAAAAKNLSDNAAGKDKALVETAIDWGALITAAGKLAEALLNAKPALTSLVGAVLFYAIAAAGAFYSPAATDHAPTAKCGKMPKPADGPP